MGPYDGEGVWWGRKDGEAIASYAGKELPASARHVKLPLKLLHDIV